MTQQEYDKMLDALMEKICGWLMIVMGIGGILVFGRIAIDLIRTL